MRIEAQRHDDYTVYEREKASDYFLYEKETFALYLENFTDSGRWSAQPTTVVISLRTIMRPLP